MGLVSGLSRVAPGRVMWSKRPPKRSLSSLDSFMNWEDRHRCRHEVTFSGWQDHGQERPSFALAPGPGQESVWDYPRPPLIDTDAREVIVRVSNIVVAHTRSALRVLETASPPTFYIPRADIAAEYLQPAPGSLLLRVEGRGPGTWSVLAPPVVLDAVGWSYEDPQTAFDALRGHLSFYPARIDCFVDGIRVAAQPGGFYGGWITPEVVGPFKGAPGSSGW